MPVYEYECPQDGVFEQMLPEYQQWCACPQCGAECEQFFFTAPRFSALAFGAWNNQQLLKEGVSDWKSYEEKLEQKGLRMKELGTYQNACEHEAKKVEKQLWDEGVANLREKVGAFVQDHTLDELRNMIKVDAAIHEATMNGDENAIKRMGGATSLDEIAEETKNTIIKVETTHAANR